MSGDVRVRGGASDEEVAAVIAAVATRAGVPEPSGYERWRAARLAAVRPRDGSPR